MENFDFCRVCLVQNGSIMPNSLFAIKIADALNYEKITNEKLVPSVVPALICSRCSFDLAIAAKMKDTAMESSKKVQHLFISSNSVVADDSMKKPSTESFDQFKENANVFTATKVTGVSDPAIQPQNSSHFDDVTIVNANESANRNLTSTPSFGDQSTFSNFIPKWAKAPKIITSTPKPGHVILAHWSAHYQKQENVLKENTNNILNTGFTHVPAANDSNKLAKQKPSSDKSPEVQIAMQPNLVIQSKIPTLKPVAKYPSPDEGKLKSVAKRVHDGKNETGSSKIAEIVSKKSRKEI